MAKSFNTLPANIPGNPSPFTLHVPNEALAEFTQLLRLSPIGPKTWWNQDTTGKFGVSREWLTNAKETWLSTEFNWRSHESGVVDIHFTALFSKKVDAIPIIFLHGYPGSFMEFLPMMGILAKRYTPETLPYHVIVPSLPDYALSGGTSENVEMTLDRAARIMNQLMLDLGFGINMLVLNPDQKPGSMDDLTEKEMEHMDRSNKWQETGFASFLRIIL
ncbi:Alpha/Beta hydrolase protein [Aspergillus pseudodeflectus]|uniref:Alpha/Beta hydrolase protein n=1 Tax=Aspergillus pseudodeflectus TaxID=176178 RepID=A0ABR4JAG5_9EURO